MAPENLPDLGDPMHEQQEIVKRALWRKLTHIHALPGTPYQSVLSTLVELFVLAKKVTSADPIIVTARTCHQAKGLQLLLEKLNGFSVIRGPQVTSDGEFPGRSDDQNLSRGGQERIDMLCWAPTSPSDSQRGIADDELRAKLRVVSDDNTGGYNYARGHACLDGADVIVMTAQELVQQSNARWLQGTQTMICQESLDTAGFADLLSKFKRVVHFAPQTLTRKLRRRFEVCSLSTQIHMRPEIADLVRAGQASPLRDHGSVCELANVAGFLQNVFWLDHAFPELQASNGGFSNHGEADLCYWITRQLLSQETCRYPDVAVLTPYRQQCRMLRKRFATPQIHVSTM
ncbi:hypothetical protein MRS44_003819 [Fusarium solani]|uniref:uncharacterized protein n=1 Tax=Fusarium solani TaxID=169388 RepID=UPI0032C45683|nr:hypothetical protein MRS44_003819 [Fusarium solani]